MSARLDGWYRDRVHRLQHRYWNGSAWGPLTPAEIPPQQRSGRGGGGAEQPILPSREPASATDGSPGFLAGRTVGFLTSHDGVEEEELAGPRDEAARAGARTILVAPGNGTVNTRRDGAPWGVHDVDATVAEVDLSGIDALVLPDGQANSSALRELPVVADLVERFARSGRPTGAFGHAVGSLLDAGVLRGVSVTSHPALRPALMAAGARWVDRRVVVDQNIITSRDSRDVEAFNTQLIAFLDR